MTQQVGWPWVGLLYSSLLWPTCGMKDLGHHLQSLPFFDQTQLPILGCHQVYTQVSVSGHLILTFTLCRLLGLHYLSALNVLPFLPWTSSPWDDWDGTDAAALPASPLDPGLLPLPLAAIPWLAAAIRAHRVLVGHTHGNPGRYSFRYPLRVPHPHPRVMPASCCSQETPLGLSLSCHSSDLLIKLLWTAFSDLLLLPCSCHCF